VVSASMWLVIHESPPVALGFMPEPGMAGKGKMINEACWTAFKTALVEKKSCLLSEHCVVGRPEGDVYSW